MKAFDLVVLGGLLICATAMGAGLLVGNGTLQFVGAFFGWFLAAYSSLRYVIQAVRFGMRTNVPLWGTLVPVNFGLALIGLTAFGIHGWEAIKLVIAVSVVAMIVGLLLVKISFAHRRYAPIASLVVLALPFYEKLSAFWTHIYVAVASSLLAVGLAELGKYGSRSRQTGSLSE